MMIPLRTEQEIVLSLLHGEHFVEEGRSTAPFDSTLFGTDPTSVALIAIVSQKQRGRELG